MTLRIAAYDHVGIRVTDAARSLAFYTRLGFRIVEELSDERVAELVTEGGARINLIFNGVPRPGNGNVLMDEPVKWPGHTHPAFIVDSLQSVLDWASGEGVAITEGPHDWGRRITCFVRDPDGNVLEFNELTPRDLASSAIPPAERLVLHEYAASGNCYKVRLTAALLGLPIERREYDILKGETRTPEFLARINPHGRIPVLQVGHRFISESNAACFYLARGSALVPTDRFAEADMLRWMFFEQYSHEPSIAVVRFWIAYLGEENLSEAQREALPAKREAGHVALRMMDDHLASRRFFVGDRLSLADIALYAYTHVAGDGGFDLAAYPAVNRWLERVAAEPGHTPMTD